MALPSIPGCRGRVGGLVLDSQSSLNPPNKAVKQTLREPDRAVDATGACEVRTEEDVDSGGDHEPVAVLRRGLAHGREPLRVPVGIAKAAGGVVGVLEVAAGGSRGPQRSHQLGRLHAVAGLGVDRHGHLDAPCDPRGRGEHLVGRRTFAVLIANSRAWRPRRRWWLRPPETQPRPRLSPWPRPRHSEAEGVARAVQRPQQVAPALELAPGHGRRGLCTSRGHVASSVE